MSEESNKKVVHEIKNLQMSDHQISKEINLSIEFAVSEISRHIKEGKSRVRTLDVIMSSVFSSQDRGELMLMLVYHYFFMCNMKPDPELIKKLSICCFVVSRSLVSEMKHEWNFNGLENDIKGAVNKLNSWVIIIDGMSNVFLKGLIDEQK